MIIVFDSLTGNVERFVKKIQGFNKEKIHNTLIVNEPYVLVTYTTGKGQVPRSTLDFLNNNYKYLVAVAASGNKGWGDMYALSADIISSAYRVPILHKFELSGLRSDIDIFTQEVHKFVANSKMDSTEQ
ncbi:class Ib ribonucleoside-diphosphate reductase assembly flavoprotein NrdI [Paenibacillus ehimensis]|uniref:class Ib ribonucleoside-diphosphate reductase assembly flavoprotein NrdI n=1 Tax=Paenibacillus ehimensis TaxID=79264 RepID=UPI002DB963D5|nr:class Ib ribonucleoside-diphosphate reductase assembly flavoprotein NrdI [Paenibacillus ehimensis]MEC0209704.1 class Ib ribonucleoside-diphosphate reductase assembly flavoprotein NrdI [Paenibacillus ehimensis]